MVEAQYGAAIAVRRKCRAQRYPATGAPCDLSEIIRESIDYGLTHRSEAVAYSLAYARDMNRELARKFIGMYVNEFTRDYGEIGRAAISKFLTDAHDKGYVGVPIELEFVE